MRRNKSRAKRRLTRSNEEDEVEAEVKDDPGPSMNIDREIDCFKEEFEEVGNVVSAVMEMGAVVQHNQLLLKNNGCNVVEDDESNFEINAGIGSDQNSEKWDYLDDSLKCNKVDETSEKGSVLEQHLNSNIQVDELDSGNEIENIEEAEVHTKTEQKSIEGEPSAAGIEVMKLDGHIDDSFGNKEDDDGEKERENRVDQGKNEDIKVGDVNEVPRALNHDSLSEQKKEKPLEIHAGGLHKDTVEQDLFEIFGKFGEVQLATIIRHPTTNKSKGYAFIQYATVEQALKVLSDLKDGIEVRGKRAKLSISHERNTLYLGNICKTWTKEDVLGKLKGYGIEDIDEIQVPNDPKKDGKIKGFAFLRFNTCSDARAAFHRLRKPDAVFGSARGAKVAFARTKINPRKEVRLQVKTIYVEGIPKSWDVQKLKEICEKYGETKKVKISRNLGNKGKDFGFISFTTRESAVACVAGINKLRFGEHVKVKAYIARPLFGGCLQKNSSRWLKFNKRHRSTGWWKTKGHARSEGAENKIDMKAETVIYKSMIRGTEVRAAAVAPENNQDSLNSKLQTTDAGPSTKPKKTDGKRKNRKNRKRRRDCMYSTRPSKQSKGSSQVPLSRSSRNSKRRKGSGRVADSIANRIPYKEAYPALTEGSGYGAISGSKRLSSNLEPHAGFVQHMKHKDQYYAVCVRTAFQHQRQSYADYLKPNTHHEQPPMKYFKLAIGNDALPHAGLLEPAFRKQRFDVDDYPTRRTGEYNGLGNQGPIHGAGSAFSLPYVPNYMSYARYEADGSASGVYPPTQTHYRPFA